MSDGEILRLIEIARKLIAELLETLGEIERELGRVKSEERDEE